jgi:2-polyprenyl-3-methyl-5-hydroxy-6-metoxy-1,4-benzoquinol methylase
MKNSYDIERALDRQTRLKYQGIIDYGKSEIDNPDKNDPKRLNYLNRLETIIAVTTCLFPTAERVRIGDFACAQCNIGLLLAEKGYEVVAVDINPSFTEYSKMKYEKGNIEWIVGNVFDIDLPAESLDMAIAGELIEHVAHPEDIVDKILEWVRPDGYLLITTPNGDRLFVHETSFSRVRNPQRRKAMLKNQFGPSGKHHLFAFRPLDLEYIIPHGSKIVEVGYCDGTVLSSPYSKHLMKFLGTTYFQIAQALAKTAFLRRKISNNIYALIVKQ